MGAKFEYDESGSTFSYFVLSFLALILLPSTYYFWPFTKDAKDGEKDLTNQCLCEPCMKKRNRLKANNPWKAKAIKIVCLSLGWALFLFIAYKVSTMTTGENAKFDPFEVLGVSVDASKQAIRQAYRKLSLIYHPDKPTGDEEKFMLVSKAYSALTDDEARENWEKYGDPNGPQAVAFGIALPSWIVDKEYSIWVLAAYMLAFMVILPTAVGTWWYKSIKYTSDEILVDTTNLYLHFLMRSSLTPVKRLITILSGSMEFQPGLSKLAVARPSDNVELPELMRELPDVEVHVKEMPFGAPYSVKARLLIYSHLRRVDLPLLTLAEDKLQIIARCPRLCQEMVSCLSQIIPYLRHYRPKGAGRGPGLDAVENTMRLSSLIVQGIHEYRYPLLQLPHFNHEILRHCFSAKKRNIRTLMQMAELPEADRRTILRSLSGQEYCDVVTVLAAHPYVTIDSIAEVKDDDDPSHVSAGSIITVTTQLTRTSFAEKFNLPCVEELVSRYEEQSPRAEWSNSKVNNVKGFSPDGNDSAKEGEREDGEEENELRGSDVAEAKPLKPQVKVGGKRKDKKRKPTKQQSKGERRKKEKLKKEEAAKKAQEQGNKDESENESDDEQTQSRALVKVNNDSASEADGDGESEDESQAPAQSDSDDEQEWQRLQKDMRGEDSIMVEVKKKSHEVHAPLFPEAKYESWWLYICDRRKKELVSSPQLISSLQDKEEIKTRLVAPEKPCTLFYTVVLRSDSYVETEYTFPLKIQVHEAKTMKTDQWDDLDEDEEANSAVEMSGSEEDEFSDDD